MISFYLQTTITSYLWTHSGNNKVNQRTEGSTYNLWVTVWLREKKLQKEGLKKENSLNLSTCLSGCLLPLHWRPGLNHTTESVLLSESWGSRQHMTACCAMHDTPCFWGEIWSTKTNLTKVFHKDWMNATVPFSSLSPPSPIDYEEQLAKGSVK